MLRSVFWDGGHSFRVRGGGVIFGKILESLWDLGRPPLADEIGGGNHLSFRFIPSRSPQLDRILLQIGATRQSVQCDTGVPRMREARRWYPRSMNAPRYFVVVFGDPEIGTDRNRVESGVYEAGLGYPAFTVKPGDMLLLYCTYYYAEYRQRIPGKGRVRSATGVKIDYDWMPLPQPITRQTIRASFTPDDWKKMCRLGIKSRRCFEISKDSFSKVIGN